MKLVDYVTDLRRINDEQAKEIKEFRDFAREVVNDNERLKRRVELLEDEVEEFQEITKTQEYLLDDLLAEYVMGVKETVALKSIAGIIESLESGYMVSQVEYTESGE